MKSYLIVGATQEGKQYRLYADDIICNLLNRSKGHPIHDACLENTDPYVTFTRVLHAWKTSPDLSCVSDEQGLRDALDDVRRILGNVHVA